jgi:hypothetical protein
MGTDVRALIADVVDEDHVTPDDYADAILAALAAHGVELVADLPEVEKDGIEMFVRSSGGKVYAGNLDAERLEAAGRAYLALAHARRIPEPDPADVEALANLLAGRGVDSGNPPRSGPLAASLLRAGVRPPKAGA